MILGTRLLPTLLLINAAAAIAATIVLVIAPEAIPAVAGVSIATDQYLLCYLVAGAEAAIAAMCLLAVRGGQAAALDLAAWTLVVLHVVTAALAAFAILRGASAGIAFNIALRIVLALLLLLGLMRKKGEVEA